MDKFHPFSLSVFVLGIFLFITFAGDLFSLFLLFAFSLLYVTKRRSFLLLFFLVLFFHLLFSWNRIRDNYIQSLASSFRLISFLSFAEVVYRFLSKEESFFILDRIFPRTGVFLKLVFFELKRLERRIQALLELRQGPKEILLHVLSYAGEEGLIRAQMMERRGFGLNHRTSFLHYSFHKRDFFLLVFVPVCLFFFFLGYRWILLLFLSFPLLMQVYEDLLWHISV